MASGDVGHFDSEGRLYIDGRDDEMIVSGGENVFPAEVEELLGSHESIQEAAAIGVDDEKFGQRLKAFVVLRQGAKPQEDEIKGYVKDNLANYKVPREVVFIDELPAQPDRQGPQARAQGARRGRRELTGVRADEKSEAIRGRRSPRTRRRPRGDRTASNS